MSICDEAGAGGVLGRGCATVFTVRILAASFHVGETAYNIDKARRGVLEKVVIKLIRPVKPRKLPVANKVLYQDTLNGLWNERDLVPYETAASLIADYATKRNEYLSRSPCG